MRNFHLIAVALFTCISTSYGAVFTVTNTNDTGPGSLRQAAIDAQATGLTDTIVFDASTNGTPINLVSSLIPSNQPLYLFGNGPTNTIIQGDGATNYEFMTGSDLTVRDITFSDFSRVFEISNNADLRVHNCVFDGNGNGSFLGTAILMDSGADTLIVDSCLFSGNDCAGFASAIHAETNTVSDLISITNTTFTNNSATGIAGGVVSFESPTGIMANCTFVNNNTVAVKMHPNGSGFEIQNCTFSGNAGNDNGGGIETTGLVTDFDLNLTNNIFTNNTPVDIYFDGTTVTGTMTTNIVETCSMPSATCPTWFSTADPLLGAPVTCGIQTYLPPGAGSLAIDNGTGGPTNDICGDPYGTPDIGSVSAVPIPTEALEFDGTDDIVSTTTNTGIEDICDAGFTMEAWVFADATTGTRSIIRKTGDYNLYVNAGQLVAEIWDDGTTTRRNIAGPGGFPTGVWTHVAFTWDGSAGNFFVNGVQTAGALTGPFVTPGVADLNIGDSQTFPGEVWQGDIDEVRIWTCVKPQAEIEADTSANYIGTENGLVLYYDFSDGTGTTVTDLSPNGNDGTLANGATWVEGIATPDVPTFTGCPEVSDNHYWVGGPGDWSDAANHWADASGGVPGSTTVPTIGDNAIFDDNSGLTAVDVVNINVAADMDSLLFNTITNAFVFNNSGFDVTIDHSLISSASGVTFTGTWGEIIFSSSTSGESITSGGTTFIQDFRISGDSTITLIDPLDITTGTMFVDAGGLLLGGNNLSCLAFQSNTTNDRTIDISNSTVNVTDGDWVVDGTNVTFSSAASLLNMGDNAGNANFEGGSLAYDTIRSLTATTFDYIDNNSVTWFEIVASSQLNINNGDTLSVDTLIASGDCGAPLTITVPAAGANGNINNTGASDLDLVSINVTGVDAVAPGNYILRLSDTSNALGWTLGSTNFFWVNDGGNWNDGNHWALSSGGAGSGCIPTLNDSTFFDANSFSAGGFTVTIDDTAYFRSMDWTGSTGAQTLALDSSLNAYGDVTLAPNVSVIRNTTLSGLVFWDQAELDQANAPLVDLAINIILPTPNTTQTTPQDTVFLVNNLTMTDSSSINHFNGVFATQDFDVSMGSLNSVDNPADPDDARELFFGASNIELKSQFNSLNDNNLTLDAGTSVLTIGDTLGFPNNLVTEGLTFHDVILDYDPVNVTFVDGNTVQGSNAFNYLKITRGSEVFFEESTTQIVADSLVMRGTCLDSIFISSLDTVGAITQANIFKSVDSAIVRAECLNIAGMNATGFGITAFFSTNLGDNTDFTFSTTPSVTADIAIDSTNSGFCFGDTITFTNTSSSFYSAFNQLEQNWFINDGSFPLLDSAGIIEAEKTNLSYPGVTSPGEHFSIEIDTLLNWNEITDPLGLFEPTTGEATTTADNEFLTYNFTVGYRIRINNLSGDTAFLVDMNDSVSIVSYTYRPTFQLSENGSIVELSPVNHVWDEKDSLFIGNTLIANDTINFTMTSPSILPGDDVSILAGLIVDSLGYPNKPRWRDGDSITATNDVNVTYDFFIDTIHVEIAPASNSLDTTSFATVLQTSGDDIEVTIEVQDPETFCISRDTILVDVINPNIAVITSQPDLELCPEDSLVVEAFSGVPDSVAITSFEFFYNGVSLGAPSPNDTLRTFFNLNDSDTISVLSYQDGCVSDTMPTFVYTVFNSPVFNFTTSDADSTICAGDLVTFNAWSADSLNQFVFEVNGIGVTPFQDSLAEYTTTTLADNDIIFAIATDSNSCVDTLNMVFQVDSLPVVTLAESTGGNVICQGESVVFTAGGSNSYEFFIDGVSVQGPSLLNTYTTTSLQQGDTVTVRGVNTNGCTQFSNTEYTYFVTASPAVALSSSDADSSICSFETVTFTGSNAATYEFFINGVSAQGPGTNNVYLTDTLNHSDTITVVGSFAGCDAESSEIVMEVFTAPTTTLSNDDVGGDNTICAGTSVTFTSTGATSYEFLVDGTTVQGPSATNTFVTSTLLDGQVVTVNGVSNGCLVSQNQTFTVLINPVVDLFSNDVDNIICEGDPITFTGANASTYEFFVDGISVQAPSTDFTLDNPAIAPGAHTVTVVGTAGNGCTDVSPVINLTVNAIPTITATSSDANNIICAGETVTFTGAGGDMYQFFLDGTPQGSMSATNTFVTSNLLDGQTLTINGSLLGCQSASNAITTTVNPVPTVALNSTDVDNIYCDGEIVDYTATGANNYEFFVNTVSQGAPSPVNTINSSTFGIGSITLEVVGEINNCFDTTTANITINPLPTAGLTSSEPTNSICSGESVTYTATGGVLYEFFVNGVSQGTLSPNDTYTTNALADNDVVSVVVSAPTGCTDTSTFAAISVAPFPTMTLVSTDTTICAGQLVDFTATGATDYEFFINGVSQGAPSAVNTLSSATLNNGDVVTVAGTDAGCTANSGNIVFVVYGFPVVDLINNGDSQLCVGEASDLVAQGASNYEFFVNGISQGAPSPVNTFNGALNNGDVVTVEGETNGCASAGNNSVTFTVFNFPTLGTSTSTGTTICLGDLVTVTGSGAMTYEFFQNGMLVQQGASTDYTTSSLEDGDQVTVIGYNGDCPSTPDVITFTVNTMALDLAVAPDAFICEGENVVFTANGADEYLFFVNGVAQGAQGPNNTFTSSTLTDQDQVTFTGFNNTTLCEQPLNDFIIMNVIDAPTISGTPTTFCEGDSVVLLSNLPYGNQWLLDGTPIPGATDTSYVATVGGDYSLDVTSGGQGDLWSVGQNATGIFGDASNFNAASPTAASATVTFDEVASGFAFMLGVTDAGELYAWGENSSGQLGNGTYTSSNVPQQVPTLTNVKTAATTENSSVAVTDAGDLYVWGNNSQGQLGTGNAAVINFPFLNPNINDIDTVAGGRDHYVFLRNDGTVWTVGDNSAGQLGQGVISDSILTPVQVAGLANIVTVGAGEYHSFAISNTNELFVWGNNGSGQLGLGDLNNRLVPTLSDLDNVISAQGGASHSIFLTSDNEVYTSGNNSFGQLGTGNANDTIRPVLVDLPGAVSISAGQYTSLVLREDASVFGFGNNVEQQLSTIPQTNVLAPTHLSNVDGVTFIEASAFSSHFLYGTEQACASSAVTVTVNPTPVVTITENNGILTATPAVPGATYQWFLNGNPIVAPNPTDPSIEITAGGEYTVEVTTTDGCVGTADYTSTLDIENLTLTDVYLFPNPADDIVNISLGAEAQQTEIVVTDQTGRIVIATSVSGLNTAILDVAHLATGVYNVTVTNELRKATLRFVKGQK